ncbi:hypothetical protein M011DRAFT_470011 [Sporormia fimetaria CBS 119925]|uniref:Nuclear pore complex subunit Nup192 n=1 Tax=Sporormia fimetaria CBS 119925 TaxID=1340428 RepID=A0A6A6V3C8_9PLEO|nr:hypothetical protein M011DRAFT_470011 [Sporormia fimetaria CBS 119925]
MADDDSLAGLQALHRDLCSVIDLKLPVLDRLVVNLEARLGELKALLDKKPKDDASRRTLSSGVIKIGDEEYRVNDEFTQKTIELADALNLDELEAAALFLGAEQESKELDRSQQQTAVIRFHRRRETILLCLQLIARAALDNTDEIEIVGKEVLQQAISLILGVEGNNARPAFDFWARCLSSMEAIEVWLHDIAERLQSAQVVGQVSAPGFLETMTFQRQSLTRQHEYLAAICTYMANMGYASLDNYKSLLSRVKKLDKHDILAVHYVPMTMRLTVHIAQEGQSQTQEARRMHETLMESRENDSWPLRNLHAATLAWWLAEYSGRYVDPNPNDPDLAGVNFEEEANARSEAFLRALDDGAFQFMLSISQDVRPTRWYDPTKTSMISSLLQETLVLPSETPPPQDFFVQLMMQQLRMFVDSFITNMPDTLRRLKVEEDDQRRRLQMSIQAPAADQPMHLERFLLLVSYAYDGNPEAAGEFWEDKESNLYGFLQWAAKRQPTPRIAMFCEMLRSLSTGQENADSAHKFLLEEGAMATGKIRRTGSLSYTHIFNELLEFQNDIHDTKKSLPSHILPQSQNPADQVAEPESATMLESYLRLLAHICSQSFMARSWMLAPEREHNLVGICFNLCADKVESALRASAFDAVASLLVEKTPQVAASIWTNLDEWTVSGFHVACKQNTTIMGGPRDDLWVTLAHGYDEYLAFVRLLIALVGPYVDDLGLYDTLPFPESLGSTRRMPGIQRFIDFVMSQIFAERTLDVEDPLQKSVLRSACLRFIATCLSTFNEDLVVFANKSSLDVDAVMDTSSLLAYVTLHPFTRVMEWLFNDKVLKALFACSHQDVGEVDAALADSPLVQSLMLTLEVMDLVMELQTTFLDIIRPALKSQSSFQDSQVFNIALTSFEDAILNNLQLIVDLGLFCGTGHEMLTLASLHLLEKLASSRKLAVSPAGFGQRSGRSKIVGVLEKDGEAERIGRCFASLMQFREEELEAGPEAPGYAVKFRILEFLNSCLDAVATRPTIAHVLLGLSCGSTSVQVLDGSLWSEGKSLFHAVMLLAVTYPDNDGEMFISWRSDIKSRCWDVLHKMWRSPLTRSVVMDELRINELLYVQAPCLTVIDAETVWDGAPLGSAIEREASGEVTSFFTGPPAVSFQNFLQMRAAYLDYAARELQLMVKQGLPSLKARIQNSLLGVTVLPGGESTRNPGVFDLFDFVEIVIPERTLPLQHELLEGVDLSMCTEEKGGVALYSLNLLAQLFTLKRKKWKKDLYYASQNKDQVTKEQEMQTAAEAILMLFDDHNRRTLIDHYRRSVLRSWVQLMRVMLQGCDFEPAARTAFILQTFQVILPKLEFSYNGDPETALHLLRLAETLIQKMEFESPVLAKNKAGDFSNDRLSQLFRAALVGVYCSITTPELRELCYQIALRYIIGVSAQTGKGSALGRHILNTIKHCGSHLLEVMCDDAYGGQGSCRISALLLLNSLVALATRQESKYILETFVALNFIGVLVDNIKHIPKELQAAAAPQIPMLLQNYEASLALLLRICQSRLGSAYVLNAGLFQAIRQSGIFRVDADLGLEFDDPDSLKKYYDLILAILRVVNAAVIARGRQNEQTVFQAREFLRENRQSVVSIFKRSVNVGAARDAQEDLTDLVDCLTVLVEFTGFLQYEESTALKKDRADFFS